VSLCDKIPLKRTAYVRKSESKSLASCAMYKLRNTKETNTTSKLLKNTVLLYVISMKKPVAAEQEG